MAMVGPEYEFLFYDIGVNGRNCDAGIWSNCALSKALEENSLNIPQNTKLPGTNTLCSPFAVGDDAFPLKTYLQKAFASPTSLEEAIFNYRSHRGRRVSENGFGILANKFQVFHTEIRLPPPRVTKITRMCLSLHNFLRAFKDDAYFAPISLDREAADGSVIPGEWRNDTPMRPARYSYSNNAGHGPKAKRELLKEFFMSTAGAVSWQEKRANWS